MLERSVKAGIRALSLIERGEQELNLRVVLTTSSVIAASVCVSSIYSPQRPGEDRGVRTLRAVEIGFGGRPSPRVTAAKNSVGEIVQQLQIRWSGIG